VRWSAYVSPTDGEEHAALLLDGFLHGLRATVGGPTRLLDLLGDDGERLAAAADRALADPVDVLPLERLEQAGGRLLAPVPVPPSVRDFYAYEGHVRTFKQASGQQMDSDWFELPVFYFQNPAAVLGARDDVAIAPGARHFDYELEFAAVIGRGGSDLEPDVAEQHIAGYVLLCDWSARDLQALRARTQRPAWVPISSPPTSSSLSGRAMRSPCSSPRPSTVGRTARGTQVTSTGRSGR
jgi:2-keto-4-pentenoate hydratase/2-oxohepta-3-ene-1,7-dioic acid hydratase in catechol pathway